MRSSGNGQPGKIRVSLVQEAGTDLNKEQRCQAAHKAAGCANGVAIRRRKAYTVPSTWKPTVSEPGTERVPSRGRLVAESSPFEPGRG